MAEKERLIAFKNRIKQLELQLDEKNDLLNQYEAIGNAADQKIEALNKIHSDKIRSLMNSIQLLKKENAQLKALSKEHKRSQLIEQLNAEVKDQDLVIQTLRDLINDDSRCDGAIVKALNAGPPKIKPLTREELKIENKKLNNQVLSLKQKLKNMPEQMNNSQVSQQSKSTNQSEAGEDQTQQKLEANENLIKRIEELKNECDELKLNLKAEQEIRERYEEEISRRGQELAELKTAKTDYIILTKKYEYLQSQFNDLKSQEIGKEVFQMNKDLEMEEMQIINKAQGGKLQIAEKSLRIEIESLQTQLEQAIREKEDLQQEYTNIGVKYQDLSKRFNEMQTKFIQTKDELNKVKNDLSTKTAYYEKQIQDLLSETSDQQQKIQSQNTLIIQQNLKLEQLTQEKNDLLDGLRDFETQLAYLKKPDAHEQTMNRQIQDLIRKQDKERVVSDDVETQKKLQQQKEYYEKLIGQLQKKILEDERKQDEKVSNISSNISKFIEQSESIPDDVNSDISIFQKQELYGGHYGLMKNQKLEQMNSDVGSVLESEEQKVDSENFRDIDSKVSVSQSLIQSEDKLLQAPKKKMKDVPTPKLSQMDSSIGSLASQKRSEELNNINSSVSQMSLYSQKSKPSNVSQISSNISKLGLSQKSNSRKSSVKK